MERAYLSSEVRTAEAPRLAAGEPLMETAAWALAHAVIRDVQSRELRVPGSTVLALVGPGNNGGDALFASSYLARRGMSVCAVYNGVAHADGVVAARRAGVRLYDLAIVADDERRALVRELAAACGTWIDGILGIGASGGIRAPWDDVIRVLKEERDCSPESPTVVAVDIPSGLNPDAGELPDLYLPADITVTMGVAKPALLLPPARFAVGRVDVVDLGLARDLPARPAVAELDDADVRDVFRIPNVDDHKYTRSVLSVLTGSREYPGAGVLSVGAAREVGVGMVRYIGESEDVVRRYPDVVSVDAQAQAYVIGSGLTDLTKAAEIYRDSCAHGLPCVLDAGAVHLVTESAQHDLTVITPHEGELAALCKELGIAASREDIHADPVGTARQVAQQTGATVVTKGAVDVVVPPSGTCYAQGGAPAWRATAGSGDVLAGLIGAMLAQNAETIELDKSSLPVYVAAAAHIHARAAQLAAGIPENSPSSKRLQECERMANNVSSLTSARGTVGHPITASTLVSVLSQTIAQILNPEV